MIGVAVSGKTMKENNLFGELERIAARPTPFEYYTAQDLWTDEHTSRQMLSYHLNGDIDVSSRTFAFIDRSVAWIVSRFGVGPGTAIADFGCGPGLYTSRLARYGADVTGIDFSERSISYAREVAAEEGLHVRYVNQDYLQFTTDVRFDLIMMIMCDYCALSPAQRADLLVKFFTFLKPGGAVLLDVYSLKAFDCREERSLHGVNLLNGFWAPNRYYGFLNTFKYEEEKVVLDKYTIIERDRTRVVYNWLQYFSLDSIAGEFTAAGFVVEDTYSDVAGTPFDRDGDEFAVVARKV